MYGGVFFHDSLLHDVLWAINDGFNVVGEISKITLGGIDYFFMDTSPVKLLDKFRQATLDENVRNARP